MVAVNFELKEYQEASLGAFRNYLKKADMHGGETAFVLQTKLPFNQAPYVADGTPYVCLRVPTGGGKTIMGAHAIGIAAKEFLHVVKSLVFASVESLKKIKSLFIKASKARSKYAHLRLDW